MESAIFFLTIAVMFAACGVPSNDSEQKCVLRRWNYDYHIWLTRFR